MTRTVLQQLEEDGIVILPDYVPRDVLESMQAAFERQLKHHQFNTWNGYEQNEKWRRLVENLLTLDPAFMRMALDPNILDVLDGYLGDHHCLTEARGWETIATKRSFHGWHNDAWYDPALEEVPREVKLGIYLSDVESGHFAYLRGSQLKQHRHGHWNDRQIAEMGGEIIEAKGPAGTCFLFDTSGIHRQTSPVLKARRAIMLNYHDPRIPLQSLDVGYGRYQPLLLNAAFLGGIGQREERILGFGDRGLWDQYKPESIIRRFPVLHSAVCFLLKARLLILDIQSQINRISQGILRRLR